MTRTSTDRPRGAWLAGAVLLALAASLTAVIPVRATGAAQAVAGDLGCGSAEVTRTLATGSAWRMCARIDEMKGLVLEHVQFRPATAEREGVGWLPVLDSLYLAQLVVPYDNGAFAFDDVTGYGFGGEYLLDQTAQTCAGDTLTVQQSVMTGSQYTQRTVPGICVDEVGTGLGWHAIGTQSAPGDRYVQQGAALEVSSLTKISWYEYQQRVTLTDQGSIVVGLGATGELAPEIFGDDPAIGRPIGRDPAGGDHATSHRHDAIYRVDFGLGSGPQTVEQWDFARPDPVRLPRRVTGAGTVRAGAFSADPAPDPLTWWRVLNPGSLNADGHPRSYELVNESVQNPFDPLTRPEVSFTNDHACQEYASDNLHAGCPGKSVLDYVAEETTPVTDPVAWVSVGFHHVVRDEDQSPMPVHWQEFSLVPRDLLAQQATTPIERSCVNGGPFTPLGSCAAANLTPPGITADAGPVGVGSVLTGDLGYWRPARATLSYQRLWLRDGEPIASVGEDGLPASATGPLYVVTAADLGHQLSVRVDATAPGIVPGSATSAPLAVPPASTPPTGTPPAGTPSVGAPPASDPERVRPRLTVAVPRGGKPRLLVRVRGDAGAATGTVAVRAGGWKRARALNDGRMVLRLPKARLAHVDRLKVAYRGDARYLPVQRQVRLPHPRR